MFDDQGEAGYPAAPLKVYAGSRVLEIDPVKQQILWEYTGSDSNQPEWTFYSSFISDARRLPNGNTFIDEGMNGRFFQVTPEGQIVWEYVSPYFAPASFGPGGAITSIARSPCLMTGCPPGRHMASAPSSRPISRRSRSLPSVKTALDVRKKPLKGFPSQR